MAAACLAALPSSAGAAPTLNCDTHPLQDRLDAAAAGSTVLVKGTCVGPFTIDRNLTLEGNPTATLDGGGFGTTLAVNAPHVVHLARLRITGGWSDNGVGGGVSVAGGQLFLDHVTVSGNVSTGGGSVQPCGGGVRALSGSKVHVTDSRIVDNVARTASAGSSGALGGGICVTGQGTLTVLRSTVSGNRASMAVASGTARVGGAGIAVSDGPLTLTSSHVDDNVASASGPSSHVDGAGVTDASFTVDTVATVKDSTISRNRAVARASTGTAFVLGSGVNGDTVSLTGSTLSGNRILGTSDDDFAKVEGGGVWAGTVHVVVSKISGSNLRAVGGFSAQVHGGGVWSDQLVTLSKSLITGNTLFASGAGSGPSAGASGLGGGVNSGTLATVTDSTVSGNSVRTSAAHSSATADGGGIDGSGEVRVVGSKVTGNSVTGSTLGASFADGTGGGVEAASITLSSSTVSGNTATAAGKTGDANATSGGVFAHGDLKVAKSTISGNVVRATSHGSSIATADSAAISPGESVEMENSTAAGNSAHAVADASGGEARAFGGVMFVADATVTIEASTMVRNAVTAQAPTATASGGGLSGAFSDVTITSSVLALNTASGGPDCGIDLESGGHNLVGTTAGCAFAKKPSDKVNVANPGLGPLAANGGPTQTVALLPGSPALNWIPAAQCGVTTDQRGVHRPQGPKCDIGAYERKP